MAEQKSDENNLAMIAHILGIVIGFIGPLIIYLTAKDKPFAYSQAKEALNFQITVVIAWVACAVLSFIGIGFILYPAVWVVNLIFCIMAAMAASKGEAYKYPIAIRLIQ
jgi:hypothetical protein